MSLQKELIVGSLLALSSFLITKKKIQGISILDHIQCSNPSYYFCTHLVVARSEDLKSAL
ncbi:hypothetical protein SAMN05192559_1192 [Halobacillus karajensis]|nr:hypothetical protein SAMN05192559_1192 [Halobacillus karajensis]